MIALLLEAVLFRADLASGVLCRFPQPQDSFGKGCTKCGRGSKLDTLPRNTAPIILLHFMSSLYASRTYVFSARRLFGDGTVDLFSNRPRPIPSNHYVLTICVYLPIHEQRPISLCDLCSWNTSLNKIRTSLSSVFPVAVFQIFALTAPSPLHVPSLQFCVALAAVLILLFQGKNPLQTAHCAVTSNSLVFHYLSKAGR